MPSPLNGPHQRATRSPDRLPLSENCLDRSTLDHGSARAQGGVRLGLPNPSHPPRTEQYGRFLHPLRTVTPQFAVRHPHVHRTPPQ